MTMSPFEPLEKLWRDLLSREPTLVTSAFEKLDPDSRVHVLRHLNAMISEKGWHKAQKISAQAALKMIQSNFPKESGR